MTTATTTPPTAQAMADRIVRRNEVLKMLGIGRTTLADWQNPILNVIGQISRKKSH